MTGVTTGGAFLLGAAMGWSVVGAVALIVGLVLWAVPGQRQRGGAALAIFAAVSLGAWRGEAAPALNSPPWIDEAGGARGRVASAPTASGRSQQFALAVEAVFIDRAWTDAEGTICTTVAPYPIVHLNDTVTIRGAPRHLADETPGYQAALQARGCAATLFGSATVRETSASPWRQPAAAARRALASSLQGAAPGDAGALLSGLVTGDDQALSPARRDAFIQTGTTHITAVSGSNLALLVTIAATLGTATGWRRRAIWQATTLAALWGYAVLVGLGPPTLRAALVASAAVLASRFGRRPDFVTLIVLAGALMVAIEPAQLWRLSFQLSFAASLALAAVLVGSAATGVMGWGSTALLAVAAAQIATLPILVLAFDTVSVASLPANLLIGPLVTLAFPLAALAGLVALISPALGDAIAFPAHLAADAIIMIVEALGTAGWALLPLPLASPAHASLITLAATVLIVALSTEGRRAATRLGRSTRPPALVLAVAGLLAGVTLGLVLAGR